MKRFILIVTIALCILATCLVTTSNVAYAHAETKNANSIVARQAQPTFGVHSYWDGVVITFNRGEMWFMASGSSLGLALVNATGIGLTANVIAGFTVYTL